MSRIAAFVLGAWFRLAFGVVTLPLHLLAAATGVKDATPSKRMAPKELWFQARETVTNRALELAGAAARQGASALSDEARFKAAISDPLWKLIPLPLRLIGRERVRWDPILFGLRGQIFLIDGEQVRLRTDARERIQTALGSLFSSSEPVLPALSDVVPPDAR